MFSTSRKKTGSSLEKRQNSWKGKGKETENDTKVRDTEVQNGSPSGSDSGRVKGVAPSLDVDIRNSLILPSMSQRFSVLLPSLSNAPEESLRTLLASQRAREHGPALTEEEEELLFAEIHASTHRREEPDRSSSSNSPRSPAAGYNSPLSNHSSAFNSSPSLSLTEDVAGLSPYSGTSGTVTGSPPPTSTSFSSFKTFGVGSSPEQSHTTSFKPKGMSYGISGGSGLREEDYVRRRIKQASLNDLRGAAENRVDTEETPAAQREGTVPAMISPERANAYYRGHKPSFSDSPTRSEGTATPMSSLMPKVSPLLRSTPSVSAAELDPDSPSAASIAGVPQRKQRRSLLSGLTSAQVKRISMALEEIGGELRKGEPLTKTDLGEEDSQYGDKEEVLASETSRAELANDNHSDQDGDLTRKPEMISEDESAHSATSSVFPFKMSPTSSTFTGSTTHTLAGTNTESASSPTRLPPSPRSHNLRAVAGEDIPPVPKPIFTPTRTQPTASHRYTLSNASTSSTPTQVQHNPAYVPGQPRPIRSMHRSEGSMSSRAATPSGQSPLDSLRKSSMAARSQSPLDALRSSTATGFSETSHSDSTTPSSLHKIPAGSAKSAVLARSRSVNQDSTPTKGDSQPGGPFSRRRAGTVALGEIAEPLFNVRRMSTPRTGRSPDQEDIAEEEEDDRETQAQEHIYSEIDEDESTPELRQVTSRHSVAASQHLSEASGGGLGWYQGPKGGLGIGDVVERAVSMQGTIRTEYDTPVEGPNLSSSNTCRRQSMESLGSSFAQEPEDDLWAGLLGSAESDSCAADTSKMRCAEDHKTECPEELLKDMSGLGAEDLALLQWKLVGKAKMEREAMGLVDSPMIYATPTMPFGPFSPHLQTSFSPAPTPPTPGRLSHSANSVDEEPKIATTAAKNVLGPPFSVKENTVKENDSPFLPKQTAPPAVPSRPAPEPPIQSPTLSVHNSDTPGPGRGPSEAVALQLPLRKDVETEKERDFRTRIAAATAALNRNPSQTGGRLERKNTKRSAAMIISGPKLISSTAKVPLVPLTSEQSVDPAIAKSLEKASGSGSKMSQRWKKLMKKGPSISSAEVYRPPPAPQSAPLDRPIKVDSVPAAHMQRVNSQSAARALDAPFQLRSDQETGAPPPSAPPNLDMFRFPPQDNSSREGEFKKDLVLSTSTEQPNTLPTPPSTALATAYPQPQAHQSTLVAAEDPAVQKFLDAGRQLGLTEDQLQEMLVQKGMVNQPKTAMSTQAGPAPPSPASPMESSPAIRLEEGPAPEKKMGLFRSLSKKAKDLPSRMRTPDHMRSGTTTPTPAQELTHDKVVVRRTMILPNGLVITPSTPQNGAELPLGSPDSSFARNPSQRNPSIRRKPINLSKEDRDLVSNSPPGHKPTFSINSLRQQTPTTGEAHGLGFLGPNTALGGGESLRPRSNASGSLSGRSVSHKSHHSSAGGSFIDMYGGDSNDGQEVLQESPDLEGQAADGGARLSVDQGGSAQAVEICEYADGQIVWNIVDALRTSVTGSADGEEYYFNQRHSRSSSYSSTRRESVMASNGPDMFSDTWSRPSLGKNVPALNLRPRNRSSIVKPRPPTDVYFTSSRDVADLIDHLSRDLEASHGRIDILPSHQSIVGSGVPYHIPEEQGTPGSPSGNSQFEDAPSPAPPPRRSSSRVHPPSTSIYLANNGLAPKRRTSAKRFIGHNVGQLSISSTLTGHPRSPSSKSFSSSMSGAAGKSVEDRLQDLIDKMRSSGEEM